MMLETAPALLNNCIGVVSYMRRRRSRLLMDRAKYEQKGVSFRITKPPFHP